MAGIIKNAGQQSPSVKSSKISSTLPMIKNVTPWLELPKTLKIICSVSKQFFKVFNFNKNEWNKILTEFIKITRALDDISSVRQEFYNVF